MKQTSDFDLVGTQILHQLSNDIVAQRGYLELLTSEKIPRSTKQIVHKLQDLGRSHHIHVELYRRATVLQRSIAQSSGVEAGNMELAFNTATAAAQGMIPTKLQVFREKPLASVMVSQTSLNQIIGFLVLLIMDELRPQRSMVTVTFRRRNNYVSTKLHFSSGKDIQALALTSASLVFLQTILKYVNGSLSVQSTHGAYNVYLRLLVSKQMKLI